LSTQKGSAQKSSAQKESAQKGSAQKESTESGSAQPGVAQSGPAHDGPASGSTPNGSALSAASEPGSGAEVAQPSSDSVATDDAASLWPQFTAESSDPAPRADRDAVLAESADAAAASTADATKKAAHRLPTGAYPVVSDAVVSDAVVSDADLDDAGSLRPRNEPHPEPADLFRPGARAEQKPPTDQPKVRRADATMQVAAVRHPVQQDDTVLRPPLGRNDDRRN